MTSRLNPYLNFNGNARQALEFYTSVFGGTLTLSTFAEFGAQNSSDADRIMHGQLETDAGYTIMAADVTSDMEYHPPAGFSVSLSGDDGDAPARLLGEAVRRRNPHHAAAEAGLGRRVRHVRRPVRRLLAGQHLPAAGLAAG